MSRSLEIAEISNPVPDFPATLLQLGTKMDPPAGLHSLPLLNPKIFCLISYLVFLLVSKLYITVAPNVHNWLYATGNGRYFQGRAVSCCFSTLAPLLLLSFCVLSEAHSRRVPFTLTVRLILSLCLTSNSAIVPRTRLQEGS